MSFLAKLNNFNILSTQKVKEKQQISRKIYLLELKNFSTITLFSKLKPFVGTSYVFQTVLLIFSVHFHSEQSDYITICYLHSDLESEKDP